MIVLGINYSLNKEGKRVTTLHGQLPFEPFYLNQEQGRGFVGNRVEAVYVGDYDCSLISVGDEIEIYYDQARTTTKGTFQPIKKIEVLS